MNLRILKNAAAPLQELAEEKLALAQKEEKAQVEIATLSAGKLDEKAEQKITRCSAVITICRSRRERLESGLAPQMQELREVYFAAKDQWNRACAVRRELVRARWLDANKPFWSNDEGRTADALAGILPPEIYVIGRAGFHGFWPPAETPEGLVKEIECFVNHVEGRCELIGVPVE